jgi:hypothetical protein
MHNPQRAWSAMVNRQNCSLRESRGLPIRVVMGISGQRGVASGKCYQTLQDGVRYTVTMLRISTCTALVIRQSRIVPLGTWSENPSCTSSGFTSEVPFMIKTKFIEEMLRQERLKAKTLDSMFRCRIEEGVNCSPFVSKN